jgi:hypothetical protein
MAAAASTGRLVVLDLGDSCSPTELARLCREVRGDAAGDIGAVGPNFASRIGLGGGFTSANSGCIVLASVPDSVWFRPRSSSSSDSTMGCCDCL